MGLAICFDIRFSELFRLMSLQNVGMIFHPAAFNLLHRSGALGHFRADAGTGPAVFSDLLRTGEKYGLRLSQLCTLL